MDFFHVIERSSGFSFTNEDSALIWQLELISTFDANGQR
jgi:hypothetical protein